MYATAWLILRDRDRAEDASQEALFRAWRDLPKLRNDASFSAWLMRLTVNAAYDQARAISRRRVREVQLPDDAAALGDGSFGTEDRESLRRAFQRLSLDHRAVVVLHFHAGLPLAEIAAALDIPVGTVKSRLHYARQSMREDLRPRLGRGQVREHG